MATAKEVATARGSKDLQLASAFTREEAAAGCADVDDEEDFQGQHEPHMLAQVVGLVWNMMLQPAHWSRCIPSNVIGTKWV